MANHIFGDFDGIMADSHELQNISHAQGAAMNHLASMLDTAAGAMQGPAGTTLQRVGAQMHTTGMQFAGQFDDHHEKMRNNQAMLSSTEDDSEAMIRAVGDITV
jgi:uncharacterized protein YukE